MNRKDKNEMANKNVKDFHVPKAENMLKETEQNTLIKWVDLITKATGEIIEPADNPVKKIRTCEDHVDELEEIKSMVDIIRGISEMCQIVKNNNEQLRGRVEKLEAALF